VAELTGAGHTAYALQYDVTDRGATQGLVARAAEAMGGLDVLISSRVRTTSPSSSPHPPVSGAAPVSARGSPGRRRR
jgi:NAD(P)-dependent dehydrogenase (short-subunit alcohol dehydrogenase family)